MPFSFPKYIEGLFGAERPVRGAQKSYTMKRRLESLLLCEIENFRFFRKLPGKNASPIAEIYGGVFQREAGHAQCDRIFHNKNMKKTCAIV